MKKYFLLLSFALLIIPISGIIPQKYGVWYSQYLAIFFFMFLAGIFKIWEFNKQLSVFCGVCLFSTFFIAHYSPRAVILLLHLIAGCLISYGISRFNYSYRKRIQVIILILIAIQVIWVCLQIMNKDPCFIPLTISKNTMVGLSAAPNQIGSFCALVTPLLVFFHPVLFIIPVIIIAISKSSFAFVSSVLSGLLYLSLTNIKIFKIAIVLLLLSSLLYFSFFEKVKFADWHTRGAVIKYAVKSVNQGSITVGADIKRVIFCNPLFGFGFGRFLTLFPFVDGIDKGFNYSDEKFSHAHNDYIEYFFELGYVGLLSIISIIFLFILGFIRFHKDKELSVYFCCIIAYLLNSSGNFLSQIAISGMLLIIFYGFYEARRRELWEDYLSGIKVASKIVPSVGGGLEKEI